MVHTSRSPNGKDVARKYPEVMRGLAQLSGGLHVNDDELCVLDDMGAQYSTYCRCVSALAMQ